MDSKVLSKEVKVNGEVRRGKNGPKNIGKKTL